MKNRNLHRIHQRQGFTLIELLTVISIIAILVGLIIPSISRAKTQGKIMTVKTEMKNIQGAIQSYFSSYSRFPTSTETMSNAGDARYAAACPDFTYSIYNPNGTQVAMKGQVPQIKNAANPRNAPNAEVISILVDNAELLLPGDSGPVNAGHKKNPNKDVLLNAKSVSMVTQPGVGPDGVYRDLWGNPYFITMDLNGDNKCRDAFYRIDTVSRDTTDTTGLRGLNGMVKPAANMVQCYEVRDQSMIWSLGPDGKASDSQGANTGFNRDNVLTWK